MKKLLTTTMLAGLLVNVAAYGQEFLGVPLEDTNSVALDGAIIKAGGHFVKQKSNSLVHVYLFNKSKIPSIKSAVSYWNDKGEWVGLRIGFKYNEYDNLSVRKNLVEKYGLPNKVKDTFNTKREDFVSTYFNRQAFWSLSGSEIEFNGDMFKQDPGIYPDVFEATTESYYIFFKQTARSKELTSKFDKKIEETNKEKLKGVF